MGNKTNAAALADASLLNVDPKPQPTVDANNCDTKTAASMVTQAMDLLYNAFVLTVNVPSNTDDAVDVEFRDSETGEVEIVRCKQVNRYGKLQRGVMNQMLRQFDYSIEAGLKDLDEAKRDIRNALNSLQRSQDPTKLLDFVASKTRWAEVIADQVAHAQAMRDAADAAYLDLVGQPYSPYVKKAPTPIAVPVANAAPVDPRIAAALALVNG